MSIRDDARQEAERRYPGMRTPGGYVVPQTREKKVFEEGAAWTFEQADRELRDPDDLARFVIENEWALESEGDGKNGSGMADWRETLNRVFDSWDADTPEDIVSAIAEAIRLDRRYRKADREPSDAEVEAAADAIVEASFGQELPEAPIDLARAALLAAQEVRDGD